MLFFDCLEEMIFGNNATVSDDGSSEVELKSGVRRRAVPNTLLFHGYTRAHNRVYASPKCLSIF